MPNVSSPRDLVSRSDMDETVLHKTGVNHNTIHSDYRIVPKFSDTYCLYNKHSKIQTRRFYHGVIYPLMM